MTNTVTQGNELVIRTMVCHPSRGMASLQQSSCNLCPWQRPPPQSRVLHLRGWSLSVPWCGAQGAARRRHLFLRGPWAVGAAAGHPIHPFLVPEYTRSLASPSAWKPSSSFAGFSQGASRVISPVQAPDSLLERQLHIHLVTTSM